MWTPDISTGQTDYVELNPISDLQKVIFSAKILAQHSWAEVNYAETWVTILSFNNKFSLDLYKTQIF